MPRARGDWSASLSASSPCCENGSVGTLAALSDPSPKPARSQAALVRAQPQEAGSLPTQLSLSTPSCSAATPARAQDAGRPAAMSVCSTTASARSPSTCVRPSPMQIFRSLPALLSSAHNRPTPTQSRSPSIEACFLEICACTFFIGAILKLTRKPRRNVTFSLRSGKRCRVNRVNRVNRANRRQQWPCLNLSFCPLLTPTPRRASSSR